MKDKMSGVLSLFGSTATLFCCALPALVSIVAGGAAVGSLISLFPWMIPLSKHHDMIFIVAGVLLVFNGVIVFRRGRAAACASRDGRACETASGMGRVLFWVSIVLYGIGAFFAYAYVPLIKLMGG